MTPYKGNRHTPNFNIQDAVGSPRNPQSPQEINTQAHIQNLQSTVNTMNYSSQPTTPPRTPRKPEQSQTASQGRPNSNVLESGSRKSRNKNKPKHVLTSPAAIKADRNTPPLTATQSTTVPISRPSQTPSSTTAYAGSTFAASPAPCDLPTPSLYSRSIPESRRTRSEVGIQSLATFTEEASHTPPSVQTLNDIPRTQESPLDLFFKADKREKAEKMRTQSANSANTVSMGPFNPPSTSPDNTRTPSQPMTNGTSNASSSRGPASGLFAMELDDPSSSSMPLGPAFSTPYNERINAARKTSSPQNSSAKNPPSPLDRSEALKAYLFSQPATTTPEASTNANIAPALSIATNAAMSYQGGHSSPNGPRSVARSTRTPQSNYRYRGESRSSNDVPKSGLRQEVTPTKTPTKTPDKPFSFAQTPTPSRIYENNSFTMSPQATNTLSTPNPSAGRSPGDRDADLRGMENNLRRLLKLDSPGMAGSA